MDGIYIANQAAENRKREREIEDIIEQARREGWNAHRAAIEQEQENRRARRRRIVQDVIGLLIGMFTAFLLMMIAGLPTMF